MRVLVACEESQAVCQAFRELEHEAYSCDTQPCSGGHPEWHLQMDCFEALEQRGPWDLLLAFPPCTHLAASGAQYWKAKRADGRQQDAVAFVKRLYWAKGVARVAIENPLGVLSTVWMPPMQILQPFQFGEPFTKRTCLWLRDLPPLRHTGVVKPTHRWCTNATRSGPRRDGSRSTSALPNAPQAASTAKARSKTFKKIAIAMAAQWGGSRVGAPSQSHIDNFFVRAPC